MSAVVAAKFASVLVVGVVAGNTTISTGPESETNPIAPAPASAAPTSTAAPASAPTAAPVAATEAERPIVRTEDGTLHVKVGDIELSVRMPNLPEIPPLPESETEPPVETESPIQAESPVEDLSESPVQAESPVETESPPTIEAESPVEDTQWVEETNREEVVRVGD